MIKGSLVATTFIIWAATALAAVPTARVGHENEYALSTALFGSPTVGSDNGRSFYRQAIAILRVVAKHLGDSNPQFAQGNFHRQANQVTVLYTDPSKRLWQVVPEYVNTDRYRDGAELISPPLIEYEDEHVFPEMVKELNDSGLVRRGTRSAGHVSIDVSHLDWPQRVSLILFIENHWLSIYKMLAPKRYGLTINRFSTPLAVSHPQLLMELSHLSEAQRADVSLIKSIFSKYSVDRFAGANYLRMLGGQNNIEFRIPDLALTDNEMRLIREFAWGILNLPSDFLKNIQFSPPFDTKPIGLDKANQKVKKSLDEETVDDFQVILRRVRKLTPEETVKELLDGAYSNFEFGSLSGHEQRALLKIIQPEYRFFGSTLVAALQSPDESIAELARAKLISLSVPKLTDLFSNQLTREQCKTLVRWMFEKPRLQSLRLKKIINAAVLSENPEFSRALLDLLENRHRNQEGDEQAAAAVTTSLGLLTDPGFKAFFDVAIIQSEYMRGQKQIREDYWNDVHAELAKRGSEMQRNLLSSTFENLGPERGLRLFEIFFIRTSLDSPTMQTLKELARARSPSGDALRLAAAESLKKEKSSSAIVLTLSDPRREVRMRAIPSLLDWSAERRTSDDWFLRSEIEDVLKALGMNRLSGLITQTVTGTRLRSTTGTAATDPITFTQGQLRKITTNWTPKNGESPLQSFLALIFDHDRALWRQSLVVCLNDPFMAAEAVAYITTLWITDSKTTKELTAAAGDNSLADAFLLAGERYPNIVGTELWPILNKIANQEWKAKQVMPQAARFAQGKNGPAWSSLMSEWINEPAYHDLIQQVIQEHGVPNLGNQDLTMQFIKTSNGSLIEAYLKGVNFSDATNSTDKSKIAVALIKQMAQTPSLSENSYLFAQVKKYIEQLQVTEIETLFGDIIGFLTLENPNHRDLVFLLDQKFNRLTQGAKIPKMVALVGSKPFQTSTLLYLMRPTRQDHYEETIDVVSHLPFEKLSSNMKLLLLGLTVITNPKSYYQHQTFHEGTPAAQILHRYTTDDFLNSFGLLFPALQKMKTEGNFDFAENGLAELKRYAFKVLSQVLMTRQSQDRASTWDTYWKAIKTVMIDQPGLNEFDMSLFLDTMSQRTRWHENEGHNCACWGRALEYMLNTPGPNQKMIAQYILSHQVSRSEGLLNLAKKIADTHDVAGMPMNCATLIDNISQVEARP